MKNVLFIGMLFFGSICKAQSPQYPVIYTYIPGAANELLSSPPFHGIANLIQTIYFKRDFAPSMPAKGAITHFYIRLGSAAAQGTKIHGYKVEMAPTGYDSIPPVIFSLPFVPPNEGYFRGLTTVFYDTGFTIPYAIPAGAG